MADNKVKKITTKKFRVSFPHVFKAQTTPSGEQRFSLVMLIPADDKVTISDLQKLAKAAAYEKWTKEAVDSKKVKINWPMRDGEEKADQYDGYSGMVFATASSKNKPKVVDKNVDPILDESEFYAGCYARAAVNAYAWEWKGKKGVSFGLINVQKLAEGERFGFASNPEDDFDVVEGDENEEYEEVEDSMFG
jgi:hypothetical protein